MKLSADGLILGLIGCLSAAAFLVVATGSSQTYRREPMGRDFQSAVGGLGLGCQIDPSRCAWQFDPRIGDDEEPGLDSIPCLSELSPWHSAALFPAPDGAPADGGE
ncbi:MAG TPA: hypothetical protein VHC22_00690 [Pirellulales bacterium]|nr:hypothetical protein [Pirellulales bacterium]